LALNEKENDNVSPLPSKNRCEKLNIALDGKRAFRRFKNTMADYPDYRKDGSSLDMKG